MPRLSLKTTGACARQAFCAIMAAAIIASIPAPASAAVLSDLDRPDYVARIELTDLDLTSERGVDRLHRRLTLKARRYCRQNQPVSATLAMRRDCEMQIVAENMEKLHRAIDEANAGRVLR